MSDVNPEDFMMPQMSTQLLKGGEVQKPRLQEQMIRQTAASKQVQEVNQVKEASQASEDLPVPDASQFRTRQAALLYQMKVAAEQALEAEVAEFDK